MMEMELGNTFMAVRLSNDSNKFHMPSHTHSGVSDTGLDRCAEAAKVCYVSNQCIPQNSIKFTMPMIANCTCA